MAKMARPLGAVIVSGLLLTVLAGCGSSNADRSVVDDPAVQEMLEDLPEDMQQEYLDTLSEIPDGSFASVRFCDGLVSTNWTNESIAAFRSYLSDGLSDIQSSSDPMSMTRLLVPAIRDLISSLDNDLVFYDEAAMVLASECVEVVSGGRGMGN